MVTVNVSTLSKKLDSLIEDVISTDKVVNIKTKKGNAFLISEFHYNSLKETLYLLSQPKLVEKIKEGEKEDISKMTIYKE